MSAGMVAENSSVWRCLETEPTMRRTSRMKPMSNMRSASSRTRKVTFAELDVAALDQVEQAAGRGDQDVDAARQGLDLAAVAQAADDHAEAQAEAAAVGVEAARDLDGELARRRQHQRARALGLGALAEAGEVLQHGQREGGGLAGAGLGDAQHVAALQQRRDGARLDRRGLGVVGGFEGTQQRLGQAEIRKRNITHWKYSPYGRRPCLSGTRMERLLARSPRAAGGGSFLGIVSG